MKLVNQFQGFTPNSKLCGWLGLPRSVYYYKPREGKRGALPSQYTLRAGVVVSNDEVVEQIRQILLQEFCCYGYQAVTGELRDMQFVINPKKVYRLMDQHDMLLGKAIKTSGKREFVKHRKIQARYPMEFLCLDIKYIWVEGEKRNYFLLTILDVYSRRIMEQLFQRSIRKIDVINLLRKINAAHGIKGVTVRNDNGSQFIANDVKQFLRSAEAKQEFTHIATPQENAYIEAFHSIVQTEVVDRFEFQGGYEAGLTMAAHRQWYNTRRKHGRIGRITPQQKFDQYFINFKTPGQAEAGSAGEQPARNSQVNGEDLEGVANTPSTSQNFFVPMPPKTQKNEPKCLNLFSKSVQLIGG